MISKMNYLLLSTMMIAAIDSTFGKCCDCCKKLCADKGSSEPSSNSEDKDIIVNEKIIKWNEDTTPINMTTNTTTNENNLIENIGNNNNFYNTNQNNNTIPENLESNDNSNHKKIMYDEKFNSKKVNENENEETLYFLKIDKAGQDDGIKECFNNTWYDKRQGKVLLLKEAKENDFNALKVIGSCNNWEITDQGNVLENASCKPGNNKWIIVEVITLDENSGSVGDKFIFYVDDIERVLSKSVPYGVFEKIKCYSIKIIAANTRAVKDMKYMFYKVTSALELDEKEDTTPGLIGLDKLNVANVKDIKSMFSFSIRKQVTLDQLSEWRFSGENDVFINGLFSSQVEGLKFTILNGWDNSTTKGPVYFYISKDVARGQVFVESNNEEDFTAPRWYNYIKEV